jgi:cardiolipin synthase
MQASSTNSSAAANRNEAVGEKWQQIVNVPNTLTAVRLFGSFVLIGLALSGQATAFICVYVFLVLTDWFDGKLAILLHQRTVFGARLDSVADALLYVTLLFGMCLLKWDFVASSAWWIIPAVATYALTTTTGLVKFHRLPSYHTYAAKTSGNLFNLAVICIFFNWIQWPFFIAMIAIVLTNLEATAITLVLREQRVDVRSIYHALKTRKNTAGNLAPKGEVGGSN